MEFRCQFGANSCSKIVEYDLSEGWGWVGVDIRIPIFLNMIMSAVWIRWSLTSIVFQNICIRVWLRNGSVPKCWNTNFPLRRCQNPEFRDSFFLFTNDGTHTTTHHPTCTTSHHHHHHHHSRHTWTQTIHIKNSNNSNRSHTTHMNTNTSHNTHTNSSHNSHTNSFPTGNSGPGIYI